MKKILFMIMSVLSFTLSAQEICNNGIDDDGDTFIDLNDITDCPCSAGTPSVIPSLIPNPSFEQHNCCPSSFSELNCATGWEQATNATSDYFHPCGYVASGITNAGLGTFPDGVACAGVIFMADYKEYLGACLTGPMVAGTDYKIKFNVASFMAGPTLDDCPNGAINNLGAVDLTIYGRTSCPTFPVGSGSDCPSTMDPSWFPLGTVNYTPSATWGVATIAFTPTVNINAIILGPPCTLPSSYPSNGTGTACYPYFLFDNLTLNNTAAFGLVTIASTGHYCTNNIVLTATISSTITTAATLQWYLNGVAILGATSNTFSVPAGIAGLGNYQVMLNDGSLCALSSMYNVNSNPPTISVTSTTICPATQTTLTANSSIINTYTWSTGSVTSSTTVNPSVTITYTVSSVFGNCTAMAISTVVVNSGLLNISVNSPVICPNETAFIFATNTPVNMVPTYTWSTGSNLDNISVTPSVTTTYTVYGASGTCTAIATSTVTVFGANSLSILGNTLICSGQSVTLTTNPQLFFATWNDGGTNTLDNYFSSTVTATPFTTTTYSVSGSAGGGISFCTSSAVVTVSVLTSPNISVSPNVSSICPGSAINLSALGSTAGYTWSTGATNTSTITVTPTVNTTYSVTGSNGICPSTATAIVSMAPNPVVNVNSPTICFGQVATLFSSGASTYTWSNGNTSSSQNVTPTVTTTYSVVGSNATGCNSLPKTATVTVIDVMADFTMSSNSLPVNSTLDLTNTSTGAVSYSWLLCNSTTTTSTNASIALKDTGICCIQLIAYHAPCIDTVTKCIQVTPESMLYIPNVFTPNGDGQNDFFKIKSAGLKSLTCMIYNRWGNKIYEWDGITGFWDGKSKSGALAADGTYFYIVNYTDAQDNKKEEKGFLTLFKN